MGFCPGFVYEIIFLMDFSSFEDKAFITVRPQKKACLRLQLVRFTSALRDELPLQKLPGRNACTLPQLKTCLSVGTWWLSET